MNVGARGLFQGFDTMHGRRCSSAHVRRWVCSVLLLEAQPSVAPLLSLALRASRYQFQGKGRVIHDSRKRALQSSPEAKQGALLEDWRGAVVRKSSPCTPAAARECIWPGACQLPLCASCHDASLCSAKTRRSTTPVFATLLTELLCLAEGRTDPLCPSVPLFSAISISSSFSIVVHSTPYTVIHHVRRSIIVVVRRHRSRPLCGGLVRLCAGDKQHQHGSQRNGRRPRRGSVGRCRTQQ